MDAAIRLQGVTKHYGGQVVLDALDLVVPVGQTVAILGPSGTGKTTLLRIVGGGLQPDSGRVEVLGAELATLTGSRRRRLRRRIGLLYQNDALVPGLRVLHNVLIGRLGYWSFGRSLRSLLFPAERARAEQALAEVGLEGRSEDPLGNLSGGQRQRVLIAQALATEPDLLLLDEPITGLDLPSQQRIIELIAELTASGTAVVLSTHHLGEARQADQVVLLAGCVVAAGSPDEVLQPALLAEAFGHRLVGGNVAEGELAAMALVDEHGHAHDGCPDELDAGALEVQHCHDHHNHPHDHALPRRPEGTA